MPLLPSLLLLVAARPPRPDATADTLFAARLIALQEIDEVRHHAPHARFRLLAPGGALRPADLTRLRASLYLPGEPPKGAPGVVTLEFGAARRLPKGRLAMDASVRHGPRGGFRAHYVVNPRHHPDSALERRSVFLRY